MILIAASASKAAREASRKAVSTARIFALLFVLILDTSSDYPIPGTPETAPAARIQSVKFMV